MVYGTFLANPYGCYAPASNNVSSSGETEFVPSRITDFSTYRKKDSKTNRMSGEVALFDGHYSGYLRSDSFDGYLFFHTSEFMPEFMNFHVAVGEHVEFHS